MRTNKYIKLINKTAFEDSDVLPLLLLAMQRNKCEPAVVVVLAQRSFYFKGLSVSANKYRYLLTNSGYIKLQMPEFEKLLKKWDYKEETLLNLAENFAIMFYEYAVHEFKHVADFQNGLPFSPSNTPYEDKKEEKRAKIAETLALRPILTKKPKTLHDIKVVRAFKRFKTVCYKKLKLQ